MTYIFIAHAPEDRAFAEKLSADLENAGFNSWFDQGVTEDEIYAEIQQATHLIAVLSQAVLLSENVLGVLEFARQSKLEIITLRIGEVATTPPQLSGVLPVDFTDNGLYEEHFETLLEDLKLERPEPPPTLPQDILDLLADASPAARKEGIEKLAAYKTSTDEAMRTLAEEKLQSLMFSERDTSLRSFLQLTMQSFQLADQPLKEEPDLPTKEQLVEQTAGESVVIEGDRVVALPGKAKPKVEYLWSSPRWIALLAAAGLILGLVVGLIGGSMALLLPVLLTGLILPYFNVAIRSNGEIDWPPTPALIGNTVLALVISGISGLILLGLLSGVETGGAIISIVVGTLFGAAIGWLSTVN